MGGIARLGRTFLAAVVAALMFASVMFLLAETPALANHEPPDATYTSSPGDGSNEGAFWDSYFGLDEGSCSKINESGGTAFVMPAAPDGEVWYALVVKQGSPASNDGPDNFIYLDPVAGHSYPSTGNQAPGYSHLIVCSVPEEPTTTTVEDTTTTTVDDTTTTTVDDTTTTTVDDTTTTTVDDVTTTDPSTTSSTVDDEVLNTTITAAPSTTVSDEVLAEELPLTGVDTDLLALLAGGLGLIGALILAATRRVEEN